MAIWSVSGSDVMNCGRNTAVGCSVLLACAATALIVKKLAKSLFIAPITDTMTKKEEITRQRYKQYVKYASAALGLAVAGAACWFVPNSRFALITDDSISKMLKLGAVQTVVGYIIDRIFSKKYHAIPCAAYIGLGGALATRFGYLPLVVLGAVGTGLGSGLIRSSSKRPYDKI